VWAYLGNNLQNINYYTSLHRSKYGTSDHRVFTSLDAMHSDLLWFNGAIHKPSTCPRSDDSDDEE